MTVSLHEIIALILIGYVFGIVTIAVAGLIVWEINK